METPTKIVIERHVPPGREGEFDAWAHGLILSAEATGALEGTSVFAHDTERFVLLRFRGEDALARWRTDSERDGLLRPSDLAPHPHIVRTGLETWFTLPGHPLPRMPPPRWKMALLTWLCLMPTAFTLGKVFSSFVPHPLVLPLTTGCTVVLLTWLLMPNVTRVLHRWLYPQP